MMPASFSIHWAPFTFNVQRTCRRPSRIKAASSSVVTIQGPSELAESFPFAGPRRRRHLVALEVATAPVVKNGEAGNVRERVGFGNIAGFLADDRSHFQLVIELFRSGGVGNGILWTENAKRVGEVEDRQPIPRVGELPRASSTGMSLVHHEVAHRWRLQYRRPQANATQRYTLPGAR